MTEKALFAVSRRLKEAYDFWIAARETYFYPSEFIKNLNALLTSLRSVTFVMQGHKREFRDFEEWYATAQSELRANDLSKWAVQARNRAEKVGDFAVGSEVKYEIVASYIGGPTTDWLEANLESTPLQAQKSAYLQFGKDKFMVEYGAICATRRWVHNDLPDFEVLEALAQVYVRIGKLVVDLIELQGSSIDHLFRGSTPSFLQGLKVGSRPFEMLTLIDDLSEFYSLKTGERCGYRKLTLESEPETARYAAQKYGLEKIETRRPLSLQQQCEYFFRMACRVLKKDGYHIQLAMLSGEKGAWFYSLTPQSQSEKYIMYRNLGRLTELLEADQIITVGEAWRAREEDSPTIFAADAKNREEVLQVSAANRDGEILMISAKFDRVKSKPHKVRKIFKPTITKKPILFTLAPMMEVWGHGDHYRASQ